MAMSRPLRDINQLACIGMPIDKKASKGRSSPTCRQNCQDISLSQVEASTLHSGNNPMTKNERIHLANKLKSQQGCYESEISFAESDLHDFEDNCDKNPGHTKFFPIDQFYFGQLPSKYQKLNLYRLIEALGYLTVRVEVICYCPDIDSANKSSRSPPVRYGSGRIYSVKKCMAPMGDDRINRPCSECNKGDCASEWLQINVITAKHIVSNDFEAANTTVMLRYNSYESNAFTLKAVKGIFSPSHDWCMLTCITHNVSEYKELESQLSSYNKHAHDLYTFYRTPKQKPKLVIIISHPHGCRKQVSFGWWCQRYQHGGVDTMYTYTAATCNGSSGAPVFIVGRDGREGLYNHIHSGCDLRKNMKGNDKGEGFVNFSCCIPG